MAVENVEDDLVPTVERLVQQSRLVLAHALNVQRGGGKGTRFRRKFENAMRRQIAAQFRIARRQTRHSNVKKARFYA